MTGLGEREREQRLPATAVRTGDAGLETATPSCAWGAGRCRSEFTAVTTTVLSDGLIDSWLERRC
jgi:hypothetical protein